jgi:hypothetical protein
MITVGSTCLLIEAGSFGDQLDGVGLNGAAMPGIVSPVA